MRRGLSHPVGSATPWAARVGLVDHGGDTSVEALQGVTPLLVSLYLTGSLLDIFDICIISCKGCIYLKSTWRNF